MMTRTLEETKQAIKDEFISRYYRWLSDEKEMSDADFGRKYGYSKRKNGIYKDNLKAVGQFQQYFFSAYRTSNKWEEAGYDKKQIWQLKHEGFLSIDVWYKANEQDRYYISQKTAKDIYRESKRK